MIVWYSVPLRLFIFFLLIFSLLGCAGRKYVVKKSDYFIPGRTDIYIRNILNYSNTSNIEFVAVKDVKEFFEKSYALPLNNYSKTASLLADIEIMDYKKKLFKTGGSIDQYIFWAKFRVTLFSPYAKKIFIDRMKFTLGKKVEIAPYDKNRIDEVGNKALFDYLSQNIINLVKFGRIKVEYNYDFEVL